MIPERSESIARSRRSLSAGCREDNENNGLMLFGKFDNDGDGLLTRDEFIEGLEDLGDLIDLSSHEAGRLFDKLDVSESGGVDLGDFLQVWECSC